MVAGVIAPASGGSRCVFSAYWRTRLCRPALPLCAPPALHLAAHGVVIRKSLRFGPLRLNLFKFGVGYLIGSRGFRGTRVPRADLHSDLYPRHGPLLPDVLRPGRLAEALLPCPAQRERAHKGFADP